jgi:import receptor subunit TOM70
VWPWNTGFLSTFQSKQDQAQAAKAKGNKYFKGGKYDQAITCYTEAIELCPKEHTSDIATFYQNRAAAHEQLVSNP